MSFRFQVLMLGCWLLAAGSVSGQDRPANTDLMQLELLQHDLKQASRLLTVYDRDDSKALEKSEYERLAWKDEVSDFDVDKNGELTHLEVAIRFAFVRSQDEITQADINKANWFMNRHDKNRNDQLDPSEIEKANWPPNPEDFDTNRDGIISSHEMAVQLAFDRGLRQELGIDTVDHSRAARTMGQFDTDQDKQLSRAERENAPLPDGNMKFDEDGDGLLSPLDLATMYAAHRKEMGLSKFDVQKLQGIFARHDKDGDGRIVIGPDLKAAAKHSGVDEIESISLGKSNPLTQVKASVGKFDANKDNVVTIAEVEAHLAAIRKRLGYAQTEYLKARTILTRYDTDRSRHIEPQELDTAVDAGQLPKNLFQTADQNKDGKITIEELAAHFASEK
ncbi:MAG: hypothetical protein HKN47_19915 [Pirellulaceae bacterium]|nr:hypothetical protein [Pirellulaceae bacterium]